MSLQYAKLITLILSEYFGDNVQKVGETLNKDGWSHLPNIVKNTKLSIPKVKLALSVLIKHGIVTFRPSRNEVFAEYNLIPERVLLILRYPKYLLLIKKQFGSESEMLLEEILIAGYNSASSLIVKVSNRVKENTNKNSVVSNVKEQFISLVTAKYLKRLPKLSEEKPVPHFEDSSVDEHIVPPLNLSQLIKTYDGATNIVFEDSEIYWCINFDRFHQDFRDRAIISAVTHRFDENAGELMKIMLQQMYMNTEPWSECSNPLTFVALKSVIQKCSVDNQLISYLDHYLTVMNDDGSKFIQKTGDASGGEYIINLKNATNELSWALLENLVMEKFGSKAARIFRLIRVKKYIEPDHIQQLAMIPAKEAKRLSYELLEENFVQIQELRKANNSSGPTKSFILFYINLNQVVRMVLEICYKTLCNMMVRRHHDKNINKRLVDKKHRVDTILMGLKVQGADEQQLQDIEEMITPPEKELLDKIGKTMKKLNLTELEIDDTIFLLQLYLMYR